jgi:5-methylcytosine-specific restriction endonuclease McrA
MRRALRLVIDGKAEIVEAEQDRLVRSERLTMPRPAVIRLTKFIHVPRRFRRQVTNTFLFARDHYRCQYCGRPAAELKPREALTRDHVIPISRGGTNDWTNVVTACSPCTRVREPPAGRDQDDAAHATRRAAFRPPVVGGAPADATQARYIRTFYGDSILQQLGRSSTPPHRGHGAQRNGQGPIRGGSGRLRPFSLTAAEVLRAEYFSTGTAYEPTGVVGARPD